MVESRNAPDGAYSAVLHGQTARGLAQTEWQELARSNPRRGLIGRSRA